MRFGSRTGAHDSGAFEAGVIIACSAFAGSGFSDAMFDELRERLDELRVPAPACVGALPGGKKHVWVRPELVAEVRCKHVTDDGSLRHPVFVRLRDDKPVADCVIPAGAHTNGRKEVSGPESEPGDDALAEALTSDAASGRRVVTAHVTHHWLMQ